MTGKLVIGMFILLALLIFSVLYWLIKRRWPDEQDQKLFLMMFLTTLVLITLGFIYYSTGSMDLVTISFVSAFAIVIYLKLNQYSTK
jgi:UDP-N-acetylmuramyl pentapeptide phosphotransferase/UDP-N-acetylglucosamine-1-phosphate transferase